MGSNKNIDSGDGQPTQFSLVLGGPIYQLLLRAGILRPPLDRVKRRMIVIALIAWLPLLVLSLVQGYAIGGGIQVPFLYDIEVHARFLVALPFLIWSEVLVHKRLGPALDQFVQRNIIRPEDRSRFGQIMASTMRLRNSIVIEILLILIVLTVGHYLWMNQLSLTSDTWYARIDAGAKHLTVAGIWFSFVSLPIVQFMLLRWYFRLFLWTRTLYLVSRLDLHLVATHPDQRCGLGFLGMTAYAFSTILFAQGVLLSGLIANRIFYASQKLVAFKMEIAGLVLLAVMMVLAPLFVFLPKLLAAKRQGLREYGLLASKYVGEFEQKWIGGKRSEDEPLIGSADIQSLADLNNSFEVVRGIRAVPFTRDTVLQLIVATLLPVAPLVLTMIPLEEILNKLIGVLL